MIQPVPGLSELNRISASMMQGLERMSTGLKINRASDDPAGYAAAKMMQRDIALAKQQQENLAREINSESTSSSKLDSAADMGLKISELLSQAGNTALSAEERNAIQSDINQLSQQMDSTLKSISSGNYSAAQFGMSEADLQIGTDEQLAQAAASASAGVDSIVKENQNAGISINTAKTQKSQLAQSQINLESTLSTIRDSDPVEEMIGFTNQGILQQLAIKSIKQTMANETAKALSLFG